MVLASSKEVQVRRDIRLLIIIVRVSGKTVEQAAHGWPVPIGSACKPSRSTRETEPRRSQCIARKILHCRAVCFPLTPSAHSCLRANAPEPPDQREPAPAPDVQTVVSRTAALPSRATKRLRISPDYAAIDAWGRKRSPGGGPITLTEVEIQVADASAAIAAAANCAFSMAKATKSLRD